MVFNAKNYIRTHDWVTRSELRKFLPNYLSVSVANEPFVILEIGSYQGLSACYFSDEWLNHPDSYIVCVDPFDINDTTTHLDNKTESIFYENIQRSKNASKILLIKNYSKDFFQQLPSDEMFDFIYIDGSHIPENVIYDLKHSFQHLKSGGILWMDDYNHKEIKQNSIRYAVDTTLSELNPHTILHKQYQIAIRKI